MHTPGPWKTHAGASGQVHAVFGADGKYVAKVDAYPVRTTDENDANARIIVASPALLKVCDRLHKHINGLSATMRAADLHYAQSELCRQLTELVRDAAIALATTQEPT